MTGETDGQTDRHKRHKERKRWTLVCRTAVCLTLLPAAVWLVSKTGTG